MDDMRGVSLAKIGADPPKLIGACKKYVCAIADYGLRLLTYVEAYGLVRRCMRPTVQERRGLMPMGTSKRPSPS